MKSIMLCHDCFHWIIPKGDRCMECGSHFDISESDPDRNFIDYVTGDIHREIGQVSIDRSKYPKQGSLYITENGLLFSPNNHYDEKPPFLIKKGSGRSLKFSLSLFSENSSLSHESHIENPSCQEDRYLDSQIKSVPVKSPADFLLSHPGVFFISFEAIRSIHKLFYRWKIDRSYGGSLTIKPISDRTQFHFDMQEIKSRISDKSNLVR